MVKAVRTRIEAALGRTPETLSPLAGGSVATVYRAAFGQGPPLVVKVDDGPRPRLDREAYMLRYLADHSDLPVPVVFHAAPGLLIMEALPGRSRSCG